MTEYGFHQYANIFPMMSGFALDELKADIQAHGVREPVWIYEGQILDGRNRYSAASALGLDVEFIEYTGNDPLALVVSLNLHRRHLTESQRAYVGGRLATINNGGDRVSGQSANLQSGLVTRAKAAEMLNVSERSVNTAKAVQKTADESLDAAISEGKVSLHSAAAVATLPKEEQKELVAKGEKEILAKAKEIRAEKSKAKRTERIVKIAEISTGNTELTTDKKYPVIYADPPWRYDYSETTGREIENHYPTMAIDEICALDVPCTDDAVLFLWTTAPKLVEGMRVLSEWGFDYRSCAIWDKHKMGMGYYFRIQHEILLIGTRGSIPTPEPANRPRSVISIPSGPHSAKPHEVSEMIEAMYPELPKLEMFCRSPRDGWDVWGNQSAA